MKRSFLLALYAVGTRLAQPLLRRKLARRAEAEPGYAHAVEERFGHYDAALVGTDWCWIHAVSLGEARAAGILIDALRAQAPDIRILLTNGTATGREEGAKWLREGDLQVWQPWDTPEACARFLDRFAPRLGVLMETEVWPELTAACAERGIPLVLANARLNAKSHAGAMRMSWLARPAYASLAAVYAQTSADAHRLTSLGAPVVGVFGNLKFDATPDVRQLGNAQRLRPQLPRPVVMFASSREGEERQLLEVLKRYWDEAPTQPAPPEPTSSARAAAKTASTATSSVASTAKHDGLRVADVQWMIVPRHPQRFDEVAALVEAAGFGVARRSAAGAPRDDEIWLGDSLGEMALYYGLADVALLGGSFEPLGGQNLIEAAACACPVVMGPSTFNFAEAADLAAQAGAALRVQGIEEAVAAAVALVAEPMRRQTMVQAALDFSAAHRGAAERTATALLELVAARVDGDDDDDHDGDADDKGDSENGNSSGTGAGNANANANGKLNGNGNGNGNDNGSGSGSGIGNPTGSGNDRAHRQPTAASPQAPMTQAPAASASVPASLSAPNTRATAASPTAGAATPPPFQPLASAVTPSPGAPAPAAPAG